MEKYGVKIKGIIKCADKFLIFKKWYDDRIDEPYQWEFLDTVMEEDENPKQACIRAIQNSSSLAVTSSRIPYTWVYKLGDSRNIGIAYECEVADSIVVLSEEYSEYKWVTAEEISQYVTNKRMLSDLKEAGII